MLREAYPQFNQQQQGHYLQQDAEECWSQLLQSISQKVPRVGGDKVIKHIRKFPPFSFAEIFFFIFFIARMFPSEIISFRNCLVGNTKRFMKMLRTKMSQKMSNTKISENCHVTSPKISTF